MSTHVTEILFFFLNQFGYPAIAKHVSDIMSAMEFRATEGMNGMQRAEERRMNNPHVSGAHPLSCAGRGCQ